MAQRSWSELSRCRRVATVVGATVQVALFLATQADLTRRSTAEVRGTKWAWRLAAFANFIGPIAYFAVGRRIPPWRLR